MPTGRHTRRLAMTPLRCVGVCVGGWRHRAASSLDRLFGTGRGGELVEELVVLLGQRRTCRAVMVGDHAAEVAERLLQLHLLGVVLAVLQLVSQLVEVFLPAGATHGAERGQEVVRGHAKVRGQRGRLV